jgi:hypothetical protein
MSRLSTHLPRLATLAVAMAAAAASYCVHADQSASLGNGGRDQRPAPTADPGKRRSASDSHGSERKHRSAAHRTAGGQQPQPEHPAGTSRSGLASATPRSLRVYSNPSRPRNPQSRRRHYAVRPRADRDAERDVDRELQRVIGDRRPGREMAPRPHDDESAPAPAAPAPAPPAPPFPSLPSGSPTNEDANPGSSDEQADVAVPAADVDTTIPLPTTASPVAPTAPSSPPQEPPASVGGCPGGYDDPAAAMTTAARSSRSSAAR